MAGYSFLMGRKVIIYGWLQLPDGEKSHIITVWYWQLPVEKGYKNRIINGWFWQLPGGFKVSL
jgi:hypothetical protein